VKSEAEIEMLPNNEQPETFYRWTPTSRLRWLRKEPIDTLQQEWLNPSTGKRVWVNVPVTISHEPAG